MNSGNPGKRIPEWVAALPIVLILIVRIVQSNLIEEGKDNVADFIGVGVPLVLVIGIILFLYL
jgi:uncharacterized membrane protein